MIRTEHVTKAFNGNEVVKDISIVFEEGMTNLIIGRSGAGKTVLLKVIAGLLRPTEGHVWYDDIDISLLNKKGLREIRMKVGMLFQGTALFDSMTVEQNIRFPLDMFTNRTAKDKAQRVDYCLERVNLEGSNKKYPSELSGGMMKRVGIARSIVLDPQYLFCDEPNSGLDPKTAILIDELITSITKEKKITTIINTHDMNSVMEIGEKISLLDEGALAWQGSKDEVMESENLTLNRFIFASPFLQRLRAKALED
jgi:phospholipid/cholesterol/gamma-HCH transport system ATP-binding protein